MPKTRSRRPTTYPPPRPNSRLNWHRPPSAPRPSPRRSYRAPAEDDVLRRRCPPRPAGDIHRSRATSPPSPCAASVASTAASSGIGLHREGDERVAVGMPATASPEDTRRGAPSLAEEMSIDRSARRRRQWRGAAHHSQWRTPSLNWKWSMGSRGSRIYWRGSCSRCASGSTSRAKLEARLPGYGIEIAIRHVFDLWRGRRSV